MLVDEIENSLLEAQLFLFYLGFFHFLVVVEIDLCGCYLKLQKEVLHTVLSHLLLFDQILHPLEDHSIK